MLTFYICSQDYRRYKQNKTNNNMDILLSMVLIGKLELEKYLIIQNLASQPVYFVYQLEL